MPTYTDYHGCTAASLAPAECFKNLAMQIEWRRNVFAFGAAHPLVKIPPGEVAFIRVLTKSAIGGKLEDMSQVGQANRKGPGCLSFVRTSLLRVTSKCLCRRCLV